MSSAEFEYFSSRTITNSTHVSFMFSNSIYDKKCTFNVILLLKLRFFKKPTCIIKYFSKILSYYLEKCMKKRFTHFLYKQVHNIREKKELWDRAECLKVRLGNWGIKLKDRVLTLHVPVCETLHWWFFCPWKKKIPILCALFSVVVQVLTNIVTTQELQIQR